MKKEILKCCFCPGYTCSALLHVEIKITNAKRNCGLGCDKPIKK